MQTTQRLPGTPARHHGADWRVAAPSLVADVLRGLQSAPKRLSPMYFYDERGSQLFDEICELPEYYITRTETGILERACAGDRRPHRPERACWWSWEAERAPRRDCCSIACPTWPPMSRWIFPERT